MKFQPDWKVAGVSVLLAFLFWTMTALNKTGYSTRLNYPLQIRYDDSLYTATSPLPHQVQASVSGNGWSLLQRMLGFTSEPIVYAISSPLTTKVLNTSTLRAMLAEELKGTQIDYIIADTLDLNFERRVVRQVRLLPDTAGIRLRPGYVISTLINVVPATVRAEGPASVMAYVPDTLRLRLPAAIGADYDETLPIPLPETVRSSARKAQVSFEIAEVLFPKKN